MVDSNSFQSPWMNPYIPLKESGATLRSLRYLQIEENSSRYQTMQKSQLVQFFNYDISTLTP